MDIANLVIRIRTLEAQAARRDLDRLSQTGGQLERRMSGMTRTAMRLGSVLAAAFTFRTAMVETRAMISAASQLEETMNKFNVVFRGMERDATAWAENLRDNFAMSRNAAYAYLASIQDMLVPMGLARDEAGKFSRQIVQLSADLGSFNNMPTEQVMRDIQSALVGQFQPMMKYGVVLRAAEVEARALADGLAATKDELTAGHRAITAYNMIMEGSADALGDLERSSGSYANQTRLLNARIDDLRTTLGTNLLPIATDYLTRLNEWIEANDELINQGFVIMLESTTGALQKLTPFLGTTVGYMQTLHGYYSALPGYIVGAAGVGLIGALLGGPAFGGVAATVYLINEGLKTLNMNLGRTIDRYWEAVRAFENIWDIIRGRRDFRTGRKLELDPTPSLMMPDRLFQDPRMEIVEPRRVKQVTEAVEELEEAVAGVGTAVVRTATMADTALDTALTEYQRFQDELVLLFEGRQAYELMQLERHADDMRAVYERLGMSTMDIDRYVARRREQIMAESTTRTMERVEREHERSMTFLEREYDRFAGNLSRTLVDQMIDGTARIEDVFKTLLRNIAAYYLQNAIIVPVIAQVGLPGLSQQAGAQMAGGGIPGLPSLPGMGFLSTTLPGTQVWGAGGMGPPTAGIPLSQALGAGALAGMGYSALPFLPQGQYSGLTSGIGGAAGHWAGGALGASMGIAGSAIPVVGTIIGGLLGGVLGSLFGSKSKYPFFDMDVDTMGQFDWRRGRGFSDSQAVQMSQGIADQMRDMQRVIQDAGGDVGMFRAGFSIAQKEGEALAWLTPHSTSPHLMDEIHSQDIGRWTAATVEQLPWDEISRYMFEHMLRSTQWAADEVGQAIARDLVDFSSIEAALADVGFLQDFGSALARLASGIEEMRQQIDMATRQEMDALIGQLEQQRDMTSRLGLDTEGMLAAQQAYVESLILGRDAMSESELQAYALEARFREFERVLLSVGHTAEDASRIAAEGWRRAKEAIVEQVEQAEQVEQQDTALLTQELGLLARIADLRGDEAAAIEVLNRQRDLEVERIDETLRPLQRMVWELEDFRQAADAAARAQEDYRSGIEDYRSGIEVALQDALAQQEGLEMAYLDAQRDLFDARARLLRGDLDAQMQVLRGAQQVTAEWRRIGDTIGRYRAGMRTGRHSPLLPDAMLGQAMSDFAGADPLDLPRAADALLSAARGALTDPEEFARIFADVEARLEGAESAAVRQAREAEEQARAAQEQIDLLTGQIDQLDTLSGQLLTIEQAEARYHQARQELDEARWADDILYYQEELLRLDKINQSVRGVETALALNQRAIVAAIAGGYRDLEARFTALLAAMMSAGGAGGDGGSAGFGGINRTVMVPAVRSSSDDETRRLLRALLQVVSEDRDLSRKIHRVLDRTSEGGEAFRVEVVS